MLIYSVCSIKSVILIREWITSNSSANLKYNKDQNHEYLKEMEAWRAWNLELSILPSPTLDEEM